MSDNLGIDANLREIQPFIPSNRELNNWRGVYLHYTKADRALPILFRGLWSVGFSHLSAVKFPMETSGFSPVQEEEGWEWISVYDSDNKFIPWHEVTPYGENVTVVTKKLPFKTKEPTAERKMRAEKLIKWRVAPRDIVALWVSDSMQDQTVADFVKSDISDEGLQRIYKQFDQLSRINKSWREKMVKASDEGVKKANERYHGADYQIIGEIAKEIMTRSLIKQWFTDTYHVTGDTSNSHYEGFVNP